MIETVIPIIAAIAVGLAAYFLYFKTGGKHLEPEDSYWNKVRLHGLPLLDIALEETVDGKIRALNKAHDKEYVATVEADYYDLAHMLDDMGYDRNIISGLKDRNYDGEEPDFELSSWAKREAEDENRPDFLATWQNHIFIFENEDGTYDIYAHYEYSSLWPPVAWKHYQGVDMDYEEGRRRVLEDMYTHERDSVKIINTDGDWTEA